MVAARQPGLGTRIDRYRCCLPALAEFSIYRREGADGPPCVCIAVLADANLLEDPIVSIGSSTESGGESGIRTREAGLSRLHTFQACSFNHSDTSPGTDSRFADTKQGRA